MAQRIALNALCPQTISNSGSTSGHDSAPFRISISNAHLPVSLRATQCLHTRRAGSKSPPEMPRSQKSRRGIIPKESSNDRSATQLIPALVDFGRRGRAVEPGDGHAAEFWAVSAARSSTTSESRRRTSRLATALQNVVWGITQPLVGVFADRFGARYVMIAGVLIYAVGLVTMMLATSALTFTIGMRPLHRSCPVVHGIEHDDDGDVRARSRLPNEASRWARCRPRARSAW